MFIHTDKRTGTVMEITSYRVPGEKNPRQSKVYIGKMDKDGVFIPNKLFIERSKKEELLDEVTKLQKELETLKKSGKKQQNKVNDPSSVSSDPLFGIDKENDLDGTSPANPTDIQALFAIIKPLGGTIESLTKTTLELVRQSAENRKEISVLTATIASLTEEIKKK